MVMTYLGNIYYQAKKQTMFQTITVRAPSHHNILGAVKGPELPLLGQVGMLILILGSVVLMLILILMPPEGTALR